MNVGNALKVTCVGFGAGVVLRVIQMLYCFDYGTGFYTDGGAMALCALGVALAASLLGGFMCYRGRRYFGSYAPRKILGLGVTAVLSGVILLISAGVQALDYLDHSFGGPSAYESAKWEALHLAFLILSAAFGVVQIILSIGFFRGRNSLEKAPLLYLVGVLWAVSYLVIVYVFYTRSPSFAENAFAVLSGCATLLCVFYLCRLFAGVEVETAACRVFITGIFSVVLTVTYCFSNLALLCLGRSYSGEIPIVLQLDCLGVALFELTFLVTFKRYSLRRTPKGETGEMPAVQLPESGGESREQPGKKPAPKRGGRRFRPD